MKAEIILDWEYGTPDQDGLYFAAVKHGEGAGFQEFVSWCDGGWQLPNGGKVDAFISLEGLNRQLVIQWPKPAPPKLDASEEFEEV